MLNLPSYLTAALGVLILVSSASANAQITFETVRVRLPSGQTLTLDDCEDRRWYSDHRVTEYRSYYYEPRRREYVVYDNDRNHFKKRYKHREDKWCNRGQHRNGRC